MARSFWSMNGTARFLSWAFGLVCMAGLGACSVGRGGDRLPDGRPRPTVTAVADRLADRLAHLVYVDAVVPKPGESWSSTHTAATRKGRLEAARVRIASELADHADVLVSGVRGCRGS